MNADNAESNNIIEENNNNNNMEENNVSKASEGVSKGSISAKYIADRLNKLFHQFSLFVTSAKFLLMTGICISCALIVECLLCGLHFTSTSLKYLYQVTITELIFVGFMVIGLGEHV